MLSVIIITVVHVLSFQLPLERHLQTQHNSDQGWEKELSRVQA